MRYIRRIPGRAELFLFYHERLYVGFAFKLPAKLSCFSARRKAADRYPVPGVPITQCHCFYGKLIAVLL